MVAAGPSRSPGRPVVLGDRAPRGSRGRRVVHGPGQPRPDRVRVVADPAGAARGSGPAVRRGRGLVPLVGDVTLLRPVRRRRRDARGGPDVPVVRGRTLRRSAVLARPKGGSTWLRRL